MKRRDFSISMLFFTALVGCAKWKTKKAPRPKRPNIVFLLSDQHRWQSMSFTETPSVATPNMKRMFEDGTSFEKCISNNPVCIPFRCMLLSGKWPQQTGAVENNDGLMPWDKTLGHIFSGAGYRTGYTGKWHAGDHAERAGFDWHMHWSNTNQHWDSSWTDLHGTGKSTAYDGYNATKMTDQALDFLQDSAQQEKPFFLVVSWNPPHAIFTDPPEAEKRLYPSTKELPWRKNTDPELNDEWWPNYQGYHAHITAIDKEIGRIQNELKKQGLDENTLIIYTADHGSMMNSHGLTDKRYPYEESCRVPLLISGNGIPRAKTRHELIGSIDLLPTLCGLAEIPVPEFAAGKDYSKNIFNEPDGPNPNSQPLMSVAMIKRQRKAKRPVGRHDTPFYYRGVRSQRYTYAISTNGEWILFDNETDPLQQHNLINDPAHAGTCKTMRAELDAWLAQTEDPYMHEAYLEMDLTERIIHQAHVQSAGIPLAGILAQLKLSPVQYDQAVEIQTRHLGKHWRRVDAKNIQQLTPTLKTVRDEVFNILTEPQQKLFSKLEKQL